MSAEDHAFYAAVFPEPYRVLGLPLQPFCLGHKCLLHRFGSAYVGGEDEPTFDDLSLSVFICHHTWEGADEALHAPDLDVAMLEWEKKLERPTWKHRLRLKDPEPIKFHDESELFAKYLAVAMKTPTFHFEESNVSEIKAPMDQVLFNTLVCETSLTQSEVMNRPYAWNLLDYLTRKAVKGDITLTDDDEMEEALEAGRMAYESLNKKETTNGDSES